jgi:3-mercaptopyruvate sulfurtransferase SseA
MTWKEFKRVVEELGVTDDMQVLYIDTSSNYPSVRISRADNNFFIED